MKLRILTLTLVIVILTVISAQAFNGQRKGFILGGGLGLGMSSYKYELGSQKRDRENNRAFATNFKIGYSPNEKLEIYYFSKALWFNADYTFYDDETVLSSVGGLGVTFNVKNESPTFYVAGGLGYSEWSYHFDESAPPHMTGFGIFGGAGYEFSPHFNFGLDLLYGTLKHDYNHYGKASVKPISIQFTLNALAY
jgi:hypothetical protein